MLTNISTISITNISAEGDFEMNLHSELLICFSDKRHCCQTNLLGEWYLPDGSSASQSQNFVVTRRDNGAVILTRSKDNVLSPTGSFCCSVQNSNDVIVNACIHIGKSSV